jgi:uncharacterized protein with PIN domain
MSPDELAQTHSQIIDNKLSDLRELFKSVNVESEKQLSTLFNAIEFDKNGNVLKTARNRVIINRAVGIVRKKTKALRPIVFEQYKQASEQINTLSTAYIQWLKK